MSSRTALGWEGSVPGLGRLLIQMLLLPVEAREKAEHHSNTASALSLSKSLTNRASEVMWHGSGKLQSCFLSTMRFLRNLLGVNSFQGGVHHGKSW